MTALECGVLGLDWTMNLGTARRIVTDAARQATPDAIAGRPHADQGQGEPGFDHAAPKALQGNIDPNVLFAPPEAIRAEVRRVLDSFGRPHTYPAAPGSTHIFNLGHGISQFTPPEHVTHLVDEVHSYSRQLRAA